MCLMCLKKKQKRTESSLSAEQTEICLSATSKDHLQHSHDLGPLIWSTGAVAPRQQTRGSWSGKLAPSWGSLLTAGSGRKEDDSQAIIHDGGRRPPTV